MILNWLHMCRSISTDPPGSILYRSESSEVPYSTNQELVRNFICCFLQQTGSRWYTYLFLLATLTRYFITVKLRTNCTILLHNTTYYLHNVWYTKHISKYFYKTFTIRLKTTNTRENPNLDLCKPGAEPWTILHKTPSQ